MCVHGVTICHKMHLLSEEESVLPPTTWPAHPHARRDWIQVSGLLAGVFTCWGISSVNIFNVKLIFMLVSTFDLFHGLFWLMDRRDTWLHQKGNRENEAFYKFLGKDTYYAKTWSTLFQKSKAKFEIISMKFFFPHHTTLKFTGLLCSFNRSFICVCFEILLVICYILAYCV